MVGFRMVQKSLILYSGYMSHPTTPKIDNFQIPEHRMTSTNTYYFRCLKTSTNGIQLCKCKLRMRTWDVFSRMRLSDVFRPSQTRKTNNSKDLITSRKNNINRFHFVCSHALKILHNTSIDYKNATIMTQLL